MNGTNQSFFNHSNASHATALWEWNRYLKGFLRQMSTFRKRNCGWSNSCIVLWLFSSVLRLCLNILRNQNRRVGRPKLPGLLIRVSESVFNLWRAVKKLWDFQNAQTVSLQNSCYIEGEVCCSTEQLHHLCTYTPLVPLLTSNYFPVLPIHVPRQHLYLIFFLFFLDQTPFVNIQCKIVKYYKYEQRNQQRAKNPTLGPSRYKQHSGLFK